MNPISLGAAPSPSNVRAALTIAVVVDVLQLPVNLLTLTGFLAIPCELVDLVLDGIAFAATTRLLGFHPVLLPTAFIEAVPGLDLIPTWTGCVAYVAYARKQRLTVTGDAPTREPSVVVRAEVLPRLPEVTRGN